MFVFFNCVYKNVLYVGIRNDKFMSLKVINSFTLRMLKLEGT